MGKPFTGTPESDCGTRSTTKPPGIGVVASGGGWLQGGHVGVSDGPWAPAMPQTAYIASWSPGGGDLA